MTYADNSPRRSRHARRGLAASAIVTAVAVPLMWSAARTRAVPHTASLAPAAPPAATAHAASAAIAALDTLCVPGAENGISIRRGGGLTPPAAGAAVRPDTGYEMPFAPGTRNPVDAAQASDCRELLAARRDPSEVETLVALLAGSDASLRAASATALANLGSAEACVALADRTIPAAGEGDACAAALAGVTSPYAQEALLALALDGRRFPAIRIAAVQSLARLGGERVHTALANAAAAEPDPRVAARMVLAVRSVAAERERALSQHAAVAAAVGGELWF